MTAYISHTTVDCHDACRLSEWWKAVLGYSDLPEDPNEPGHPECMIVSPDGRHQGTRDQEVDRLRSLGAVEVDDQRDHYGPSVGWVVMHDIEGNEFCVLRSEAERASAQ